LESLQREKGQLVGGSAAAREKTIRLKQTQDDLFGAVTHTREFVLDAEANATIGKIVAEQAGNIDVALCSDSPAEFAVKVKNWLSRQDEDTEEASQWSALGKLAAKYFPICPGPSFVLGPLPTVEVVRQARQKKTKDKIENLKKAEKLEEEDDPEKTNAATMKQVDMLDQQLTNIGDFPAWQLIANPESMAQSVEHMFHLSFLVKEGKAEIFPSAVKGTMVRPRDPPDNDEQVERVQAIVKLDMAKIQAVAKKFKISNPVIAHRKPVAEASPSPRVAATQILQSPAVVTPVSSRRRP
jgi:hypothetical protein